MMHNAWCSTEEVPYCFSRSSIKFEGHVDRKIDVLNPILSKITRLVAAYGSAEGPPRGVENRNLLSHPDDLRMEVYVIRMTY